MNSILEIKNLTFFYPEQTEPALSGAELKLREGSFTVLAGPSGCGKSTLLRQLKTVLAPYGRRSGDILFEGQALDSLDHRAQSTLIGFVQQSPENQAVTDKVWHELAFGLESLGMDTPSIRRKVAEMASFFGIQNWFYMDVAQLSGGQKQLLNLASVMVMQPKLLILDEPTSQLDPIAALDFLATLGKINRELGTTVLLTEHRLEEALPMASELAVMDRGKVIAFGSPDAAGEALRDAGHSMFLAMPSAMRIWAACGGEGRCPVTVREGKDWLAAYSQSRALLPLAPQPARRFEGGLALSAEDVWFKYEKDGPDIVRGLELELRRGEFLAVLGGNGTGKTTSLKLVSGLLEPYRGSCKLNGRAGVLPQNPQSLFVKKTVREDLAEVFPGRRIRPGSPEEEALARTVSLCGLGELLERHPYDLSGGEQQRAALAKVLLLSPDILLLDEPTKGLDAEFKQIFAEILRVLLREGVAVLMVSHDVEFCAKYAHRCALFFDGGIVAQAGPREFFSGNSFYTTSANRISRGFIDGAVTAEDVISACGGELPPQPGLAEEGFSLPEPVEDVPSGRPAKLPLWRKLTALGSGAVSLAVFLKVLSITDLSALVNSEGLSRMATDNIKMYGFFIAAVLVFALSIGRRSAPSKTVQTPPEKRGLSKRTRAAAAMILLMIPFTLFVGEYYLAERKYYFISVLVLLECMVPFFLVFESRKPKARELVIIAVLCALGVAGRAAFFMLPNFKPVMALTIVAGVAFGGEVGFMVGSVTMLASNVMFGQGPLTPWQMFAMGIIGFIAGVLFRKGLLRRTRGSLCAFGVLAAVTVYGGLMNPASALTWSGALNLKVLMAYYVTGFPVDCVHAAATWIFLWFGAEPMLEKLDRVKVKYGLVE